MESGGYQDDDAVLTPTGTKRVTLREAAHLCCEQAKTDCPAAVFSSFRNRYLLANVMYFIYATGILYIDLVLWPNAWTEDQVANVNRVYLGMGVAHLLNALLYVWTWLPLGYGLCNVVQIPEFLNVLSACLYIYSAWLYPQESGGTVVKQTIITSDDDYGYYYYYQYLYDDPTTIKVHNIETGAATIECFAAFGWVITWWLTYPRYPGRGWTFDDPDAWANLLIVAPSIMYLAYNVYIQAHPEAYGSYDLYVQADIAYWVGAVMYLLAALRDDGYFFWMPTAGVCPYGLDSYQPIDPVRDSAVTQSLTGAEKSGSSGSSSGGGGARGSSRTSGVSSVLRAAGVAVLAGAGWVVQGVRFVATAPSRALGRRRPEGQALMGGSTKAMGMV